jgi:hypothetical protein
MFFSCSNETYACNKGTSTQKGKKWTVTLHTENCVKSGFSSFEIRGAPGSDISVLVSVISAYFWVLVSVISAYFWVSVSVSALI